MQHGRKISVPAPMGRATVHDRRPGSPDETPDGSYPDNLSYTVLHNDDSLQRPTPRRSLHVQRCGHDQSDEHITSTEQSSFTCITGNHSRNRDVFDLEPHAGRKSSSSRSTRDKDNLRVPPRQRHIHFLRNWKWEALSIVSSLGLLGAVIGTLAKYDRGTQPEWPYNININSLISVFTAILVAQLSFIVAESMYHLF